MKDDLSALAVQFAILSLFAVGGIVTILPEMHRFAVDVRGWMTDREFTQLFAIAQAAPGPNMLLVTLIGWRVAGFAGALIATLALTLPCCLLTYLVYHAWSRFEHAPWRRIIQLGLAPVTVGFIAASAFLLAQGADTSVTAFVITMGTAAASYFARVNPLVPLALAAGLGLVGLV